MPQYVETTEGVLERDGANKAFQATLSSTMMPMGASFLFSVHFMLLIQVLNVPFTMLEDRMLKRHLWPSLLGQPEDELPPVETLVAEPSGILFADPCGERPAPSAQLRARTRPWSLPTEPTRSWGWAGRGR